MSSYLAKANVEFISEFSFYLHDLIRIKGRRYGVKFRAKIVSNRTRDSCALSVHARKKRRWDGKGRKSLHAPLSAKRVHENPLTRQTNTEWCIRLARVHEPRHESVDRPCKRPCQVLPSRCQVWKLWAFLGTVVPRNGAHEPDNIDDPRVKFTTEIETDLLEFLLDIYILLHGDERLMGMFIPSRGRKIEKEGDLLRMIRNRMDVAL